MSFKKPFRAVPVRPAPRYRQRADVDGGQRALKFLGAAAVVGVLAGVASVATTDSGRSNLRAAAAQAGFVRAHDPPPGAYYSSCNDARAAGVTPLRFGEPGYREDMDGDGDGIACEPYRRY